MPFMATKQQPAGVGSADVYHHADQSAYGAPAPEAVETWRQKLPRGLAHNLHWFTFAPLIIISSLQDINMLLAAALSTGIVVAVLSTSCLLWRAGYVKVFPKPFDLFNLALYGSMIPLSLCAHDWLLHYISLLTNGGNASFMWATILLPFTDNFVMHSVRDRVPERLLNNPLLRRMALLVSLTWATALTIMTVGAIIPLATKSHPTEPHMLNIICSYVLGFGPLLLAVPIQFVITKVYRKRMMQQYHQHLLHQQQQHQGGEQQQQQQATDKQVDTVHPVVAGFKAGDDQV